MSDSLLSEVRADDLVSMASWVMSMNQDVLSDLQTPPAELAAMQSLVGSWQGDGVIIRPEGNEIQIAATLNASVLLGGWLYRLDRTLRDSEGKLLEASSAMISFHQNNKTLKSVEYLSEAKSFVHRSGRWQNESLIFTRDPNLELIRSRVSLKKIRPRSFLLLHEHSCDGGLNWLDSLSSLTFSRI